MGVTEIALFAQALPQKIITLRVARVSFDQAVKIRGGRFKLAHFHLGTTEIENTFGIFRLHALNILQYPQGFVELTVQIINAAEVG